MALPQPKVVLIGNSMVLELSDEFRNGLRDTVTGEWILDATVTATLKNASGVSIAGQTWPLTLAFVTGSRGVYRGTLESDLVITDKQALVCVVDISHSGSVAHTEVPMVGAVRKK